MSARISDAFTYEWQNAGAAAESRFLVRRTAAGR